MILNVKPRKDGLLLL